MPSKNWNNIFVYGTLKRGYNMLNIVPDAVFLRETTLYGFNIYDLGSYPGIKTVEDKDNSDSQQYPFVRGELWSVSDEGLARLDRYEGSAYSKIMVEIEADFNEGLDPGETEWAVTYHYDGNVSHLKPIVNGEWKK